MVSLTAKSLAECESWKFVATVCDGHVPIADQGFLNAALLHLSVSQNGSVEL
jgi:hypothetical protein